MRSEGVEGVLIGAALGALVGGATTVNRDQGVLLGAAIGTPVGVVAGVKSCR